ncbi:MAG: BlaI/MecI/CopY family transcriptional regulator [Chlamydiales bacterium]|nr:BlaI/MecI/CopY family transcriptional regulator [Chlamydiales bacterium]
MAKRAFGDLELQVLNILKSQERMTIKEVHRALGGNDNYNTIMTVMNRLTEKKQLAREKAGLQYEYWTIAQKNTPSLFEKFKQKLFGVKTSAMVSYLLESAEDLTDEDVLEMEKTLERVKAKKKK